MCNIIILVVCPSICNCGGGGQQKQFDLERQDAASLTIVCSKLELGHLCERH